jgi:hypothetical protein
VNQDTCESVIAEGVVDKNEVMLDFAEMFVLTVDIGDESK